jgi:hypothetical protein
MPFSKKNEEIESPNNTVVQNIYSPTWNPYQTITNDGDLLIPSTGSPVTPTSPAIFFPKVPSSFDKR